jgi:hypothetical protein
MQGQLMSIKMFRITSCPLIILSKITLTGSRLTGSRLTGSRTSDKNIKGRITKLNRSDKVMIQQLQ